MKLIIEAQRQGYATSQIKSTMTVGELIAELEQYDENLSVYLGHDRQSYGFYTYGGIATQDIFQMSDDEDDEEDY